MDVILGNVCWRFAIKTRSCQFSFRLIVFSLKIYLSTHWTIIILWWLRCFKLFYRFLPAYSLMSNRWFRTSKKSFIINFLVSVFSPHFATQIFKQILLLILFLSLSFCMIIIQSLKYAHLLFLILSFIQFSTSFSYFAKVGEIIIFGIGIAIFSVVIDFVYDRDVVRLSVCFKFFLES